MHMVTDFLKSAFVVHRHRHPSRIFLEFSCDLGSTGSLLSETPWQELIILIGRTLALVRNGQHNSISMDQWHVNLACSGFCPQKKYSKVLFKATFCTRRSHTFHFRLVMAAAMETWWSEGNLGGSFLERWPRTRCMGFVTVFGIETAVETINRWCGDLMGFMEPWKNRDLNAAMMVERRNHKQHRGCGETLPQTESTTGPKNKKGIAKTNLDIEGKPSLRCISLYEHF